MCISDTRNATEQRVDELLKIIIGMLIVEDISGNPSWLGFINDYSHKLT